MSVMALMPTDTELSVHVEQQSDLAGGISAAVFDSKARTYRYLLTRIWDPSTPPVVFLMLNPSTADALEDDATITRLIHPKSGFAHRMGAGGLIVVNLFAVRSKDPRVLRHHEDPVGPLNDAFIRQATDRAKTVVAAWGAAGVEHNGRGARVAEALRARRVALQCLGVTSTGQPRHPLYLPSGAALEPYGLAS